MKRVILSFLFLMTAQSLFAVGENGWFDNGGGGGTASSISTATKVTGGTQGSVLFITTGAVVGQDNTRFFWDEVHGSLGIDAKPVGSSPGIQVYGTGSTGISVGNVAVNSNRASIGRDISDSGTLTLADSGNAIFLNVTNTGLSLTPPITSALTLNDTFGFNNSGAVNNRNDIFTATGVFNNNIGGEQQLFKFVGTTSSTQTTQLSSTLWAYMNDNSSGTVTTAHAGAIFGRVIGSTQSQDFMFGVEGNSQNHSLVSGGVSTTGAGIGVIGHAIWNGLSNSTPTVPTIGVEARAEITDPSISVNKTGAFLSDVVAFRGETYDSSTSTWNSRNYWGYGAVGGSDPAKLVLNGPMMTIPPSAQTVVANGIILADACGGVKQITSAGAVATDPTNTFSVPSVSTVGTANTGCFMSVVNSGSSLITLKANATFLTFAGEDINLNAAGGSVWVFSNGANWVQASPVTYPSLAGVYLSSVTASSNTAASTTYGNHGTITLTPGDWDVTGVCDIALNGSVTTAISVAVSANSGNTTTDQVSGDNQLTFLPPTAAADVSAAIPAWRKAVASNTAVFIKVKATFSPGTPQAACRISARRAN